MGNEQKRIDSITSSLNLLKRESSEVFKLSDLSVKFKENRIPYYRYLPYFLEKFGCIVSAGKSSHDGYKWAFKEPIHFTKIEAILSEIRKIGSKKSTVSKAPREDSHLVSLDTAIQNAITLLLKNDYKVSKKVVTYEDITL